MECIFVFYVKLHVKVKYQKISKCQAVYAGESLIAFIWIQQTLEYPSVFTMQV